jgi:hypothetical protein
MLQDLGTLAPSAIICVAFLVGVIALVKHEMAPRRKRREAGQADDDQ